MSESVLLTDKRKELLDDYNSADPTERNRKWRLKQSVETVLQELIVVAQSTEIDNSEVFEPNDVARLIDALMTPTDGLIPRWNYDGDPTDYRDTYQYQFNLHGRLDHRLDGYGDMLHRDYPPGEQPTFNVDVDTDDLPDD